MQIELVSIHDIDNCNKLFTNLLSELRNISGSRAPCEI